MKNPSVVLLFAIMSATTNAQDVKQAASKMDAFASKTGVIVSSKLPPSVVWPLRDIE